MKYFPWPIQNALDNRARLGPEAVTRYWEKDMDAKGRRYVDSWILQNRPDVLDVNGPHKLAYSGPLHRFERFIEILHQERQEQTEQKPEV